MDEAQEDPREVPWHPRFAREVVGHDSAKAQFLKAFASGRPHHAWLIHGPKGIGKASLAYQLAGHVLGAGASAQSRHWLETRSHPDLFVLERQLNDAKPTRRLKAEIAVDDARKLAHFLGHTAAGAWRVAIIDAADDLNAESANAILKLVEEPPSQVILLLVCHQPGTLLRTLKSRCLRLPLHPLSSDQTDSIISNITLDPAPKSEDVARAVAQSGGSPGRALQLLSSAGAKAFARFSALERPRPADLIAIASQFGSRAGQTEEFGIFNTLLLDWMAARAAGSGSLALAEAHARIAADARRTEAFNLDRRQAVLAELTLVNDALKAS